MFGDCIKDDDNRRSILHRQRILEIAENVELAKLKCMCRHGVLWKLSSVRIWTGQMWSRVVSGNVCWANVVVVALNMLLL